MARDIQIHPVLNGFVVQCGCQSVVFTDLTVMAQEIKDYYCDPDGTEKRYIKYAVNKTVSPNGWTTNPDGVFKVDFSRPTNISKIEIKNDY